MGGSVFTENNQLVVYYYADASSGISDADHNGRANAWCKVPDKAQAGLGHDVDVGHGAPINYISAWSSNTINAQLAGGKAIRAGAALKTPGRPRVSVRIDVRGI